MVILITLAWFPFLCGIVSLFQAMSQKDEDVKHSTKTYGKAKFVIGFITGIFLTFLYTTIDFFSGHYGFMAAMIICWLIVSACNVVAYVKLGMEEYDKTHPQDKDE